MTSLKLWLFRLSGLNSLYSKRLAQSISEEKRGEGEYESEEGGDEIQMSLSYWFKLVSAAVSALVSWSSAVNSMSTGLLVTAKRIQSARAAQNIEQNDQTLCEKAQCESKAKLVNDAFRAPPCSSDM